MWVKWTIPILQKLTKVPPPLGHVTGHRAIHKPDDGKGGMINGSTRKHYGTTETAMANVLSLEVKDHTIPSLHERVHRISQLAKG